MSKYIKLEDAIYSCRMMAWPALESLPTIEISEDCISRKWLVVIRQRVNTFATSVVGLVQRRKDR